MALSPDDKEQLLLEQTRLLCRLWELSAPYVTKIVETVNAADLKLDNICGTGTRDKVIRHMIAEFNLKEQANGKTQT